MKRSSEKFLIDQYKRHQKEAMEIRLNNQRIIVKDGLRTGMA